MQLVEQPVMTKKARDLTYGDCFRDIYGVLVKVYAVDQIQSDYIPDLLEALEVTVQDGEKLRTIYFTDLDEEVILIQ